MSKKTKKWVIALMALSILGTGVYFFLKADVAFLLRTSIFPSYPAYPPVSQGLLSTMKTKGCVFDGLFNDEYGGDFNAKVDLLSRSNCEYLHRSIETWNIAPNFAQIEERMKTINSAAGRDFLYSLFVAESIDMGEVYFYPEENRSFVFSKMCQRGTEGDWGPGTCKPTLESPEYRKYVLFITKKAIDLGVRDIVFGQIYHQEPNWDRRPIAPQMVADIKSYAVSKGKDIAIGAQTNDIEKEQYLRSFDYITGGIGQDERTGYIEDEGPCWSYYAKNSSFCWAMIWNEKFKSRANNIFVYLDWNSQYTDDMSRYTRMDSGLRHQFLGKAYDFFLSRDIGFLMPMQAVLFEGNNGCYGASRVSYSASNKYSCKDEDAINAVLSGTGFLPLRAQFVDQTVPDIMVAGKSYDVSITMRNNGFSVWSSEHPINLGSQNPQDNTNWGIGRIKLDPEDRVKPGETKTFEFYVVAPKTTGMYNFQWRMVDEGKIWFGEPTQNRAVRVVEEAIPLQAVPQR